MADGTVFQIRQIQALDADPLFSGSTYTFSVEADQIGFEIEVRIAPIFVHLACRRVRACLSTVAVAAVELALATSARAPRTGEVSPQSGALAPAVALLGSDGCVRFEGAPIGRVPI